MGPTEPTEEIANARRNLLVPVPEDNYGVLLHDSATGATAAIDAPEAAPVEAALKAKGWRLTDILVVASCTPTTLPAFPRADSRSLMPRRRPGGRGAA